MRSEMHHAHRRLRRTLAPLAFVLASGLASGCLIDPDEPDCEGATNCGECLERSGCGWCGPRGRCVPGTSAGPEDDFIDCESELEYIRSGWRYSSCTTCSRIDTCGACHDEYCTWCADGAGYCVSASDDAACRNPIERGDVCAWPIGDAGPAGARCTDTCMYAFDGECDDGGPGADHSVCAYGTDCGDCGLRN